jgi:hypothetical protein
MLTPTEIPLWQLVTAQFRLGPDPTRLSTATAQGIATRQAWHELTENP